MISNVIIAIIIVVAFIFSPVGILVLYGAAGIIVTVAFGYGVYWCFIWPIEKIAGWFGR